MRRHGTQRGRLRFGGWWLPAVLLAGAYLGGLAFAGLATRPRHAEVAVVLGNAVQADGRPSPRLRARLDAALRLWRAGTVRRVLVSGGIEPAGHRDEAAAMARYLRDHGMPGPAVLEDRDGRTTMDTARNTAALVGTGAGVVVVSQWYHLPRAVLAMQRFGMHDVSGDWPRWFEARDAWSLLREAVALPVYALRPLNPIQPSANDVLPSDPRRSTP